MADNTKPEKKVSFKETLNLPHTDFPIRSNPKVDDPAMIDRWKKEDLYRTTFYHNEGKEKFILHDGPPYANGHLHLGHAYNKILKDIVTKSQRMFGKQVPVTPGWDCHGLPIELQVTKENPDLSPQELKKACRAYAAKWIDIQREEFKSLGVLMDWDNPYRTMDFDYEASILRAFGQFVADRYIERKNKTVPWCASCQTVLATAEIEYQDRKDPSIYVLFPLEPKAREKLFPQLSDKEVNLLVWTTTPWTLPLNRAVLLKPGAEYVVLEAQDTYFIVGKNLADHLTSLMDVEKKVVAEFSSDTLVSIGSRAIHPFVEGLHVPILLDQSVSLKDGTACVHSAPGCGPQDYEVGVKNNLEIFSPISPDGKYTIGIAPKELEGMPVVEGQIWVIKTLAAQNKLFFKTNIKHSYPHCWRCRNGLIFRATKQWFCDLSRGGLKQKTLEAIDTITTIPQKTINRLKATVEGRLEWCLSRQRVWGVPIPALLCTQCDYTYINQALIEKVAAEVAKQGIVYWDIAEVSDLLPRDFTCPLCKSALFKKERDILDVWFDAGISHFAVLKKHKDLRFPADIYLEGKDQHRGWFQSSLLTSMVLAGKPCMNIIFTHGFTVDEQGRKMSKSLGNVVAPQDMIDKLGTDGLRLWVSSIDSAGDAIVSDILMRNVQEVLRKIRNTLRFLLSNLYDFNKETDAVAFDQMQAIDQYALQELFELNYHILKCYAEYDFTAVFHALADYCSVNLSSFYLDIIKDRLYCEQADRLPRRSAQTACWYILDTLTKLIAPILSFTAEQVTDHYQRDKKTSVHLQQFENLQSIWKLLAQKITALYPGLDVLAAHGFAVDTLARIDELNVAAKKEQQWDVIKNIRSALLKAIEEQREQGLIKHSLEARITVYFDVNIEKLKNLPLFFKELQNTNQTIEAFFKELLIVSQFIIAADSAGLEQTDYEGLYAKIERAIGDKCPRCWQWEPSDHEQKLCSRCQKVLRQ